MIRIKRLEVDGKAFIGVVVPYQPENLDKIKSVPLRKWDGERKCWLVPYSKEIYQQLKALFPDLQVETTIDTSRSEETEAKPVNATNDQVLIHYATRRISLQLAKNDTDTRFLRSLKYARWDTRTFQWLVTGSEANRDLIKKYFGERLKEMVLPDATGKNAEGKEDAEASKVLFPEIPKDTLIVVHYQQGRARLLFRYHAGLIALVKTLPYCRWDAENHFWSIGYAPVVAFQLEQFCQVNHWKLETRKEGRKANRSADRKMPFLQREVPDSYLEKLTLRRYSHQTVKSYKYHFKRFINYYADRPIDEITEKEILAYLRYLVQDLAISGSSQNQSINAIKFYYEQVLNGNRKFY